MEYFVSKDSVVRQIWGKSDTILFIFAGASAEFALNKAVDWLYFTGRLPADPLGRLFSTVSYARKIVFAEKQAAEAAIHKMAAIHADVEARRGKSIPDWAYRDVLFMLIDYSIRSFELLERKLNSSEKEEVFRVFCRVGNQMGLQELPDNYKNWKKMRQEHLLEDLHYSHLTEDLFTQYHKHLGAVRYRLLLEAQKSVVPERVTELLDLGNIPFLAPLLAGYKLSRNLNLDWLLKEILLPSAYKEEIRALDTVPHQN